jgi:hypothetical protein
MYKFQFEFPRRVNSREEINNLFRIIDSRFNSSPYVHLASFDEKRALRTNYHLLQLNLRLKEIRIILERLFGNIEKLVLLDDDEQRIKPENYHPHTEYSESDQTLWKKVDSICDEMVLDFESLYIYSSILLDQWTLVVSNIYDFPDSENISFEKLVEKYDKGILQGPSLVLWKQERMNMLSLRAHIRCYRNYFIVHNNQPFQVGYGREIGKGTFALTRHCTYINEQQSKELDTELVSLVALYPKSYRDFFMSLFKYASRPVILSSMLDALGFVLDNKERAKIWKFIGKAGFSTPSFQNVAFKVLSYLERSTRLVLKEGKPRN